MEKKFRWVDENHDLVLQELFPFLRQKSISATGEGIAACAEMLRNMMEVSGINARIIPTSGCPIVYGDIIEDPNLPTVLIYGHYDVQPPEPLEEWNTDPFEPVMKDGRIFCRGSSDNKGQMFCHIMAARLWKQFDGHLPVNVKYVFEGEEETGSPHLQSFVHDNRDLLACDITIISDSHMHESGRPSLILGLKGMCCVELEAVCANRDLHSKYAAAIPNPAWKLLQALQTIKHGNIIAIPGFYDDVRLPLENEAAACRLLPYDEAAMLKDFGIAAFLTSRSGSDYYYNMMFEPTCNINGIFSGYTGKGSKNVLPHTATARLDFRLVPDQTPEKIYDLLVRHLERQGFSDIKVKNLGNMPPSRTSVDHPYVSKIAGAVKSVWGEEPLLYPSIAGSGPTYVFDTELLRPNITIPFAAADQNNHGPNESFILRGLWNGIKTGVMVLGAVAEIGAYA